MNFRVVAFVFFLMVISLYSQTVWEQYLPDTVTSISQIGNKYLAVSSGIGGNGSVSISDDLRFWKAIKPYKSFSGEFGCYGGSTIILKQYHKMQVSTDNGGHWQEINWSGKSSLWDAPNFSSFASNGKIFVGVGDSGLVLRSTDGIKWERQTTPIAHTVRIGDLACVNNLFLAAAADSSIISSQDGITWNRFKCSGMPGGAPFSYDSTRNVWKYAYKISSDGKTWISDTIYPKLGTVIGNGDTLFVKSGSSIYKIVGGQEEYRYSLSNDYYNDNYSLFFDGTRFVLHDGFTILSSVHGDSWDTLTNGIGKTPIATIKTPIGRCAFTADGVTIRTTNDSTWEYVVPDTCYKLKAVVIRDSVLYALEDEFARPAILKSVDYGSSWQRVLGDSWYLGSSALTSLYADSSVVIATGEFGKVVISPSPTDAFRVIPVKVLPQDSAMHSFPDLLKVVKLGGEYIVPAEHGYGTNGLVRRYVNDTLWVWDSVPELADLWFNSQFTIGGSMILLSSGKKTITSDGKSWSVQPSNLISSRPVVESNGVLLTSDQGTLGFSYSIDSAKTWKSVDTYFEPGLFYSSDGYFYNSVYRSAADINQTPIASAIRQVPTRSVMIDRNGKKLIFSAKENCDITLSDIRGRVLVQRNLTGGIPLSIDLSQFATMQILYRVTGSTIESGVLPIL